MADHHPHVHVHDTPDEAGAAAASAAEAAIERAIRERGRARVVLAAAPSQAPLLHHLSRRPLPWDRIEFLHMDEYVGLEAQAPQRFASWLRDQLAEVPRLRLEAIVPEPDADAECRRYAALLAADAVDLVCLGLGVNGHLAFNEPDQCDLDDPVAVRRIALDLISRQQQVDEGLFLGLDDVPVEALTLTVPALLSARTVVLCALGSAKAAAAARMLTAPVSAACPGTAIRTHGDAQVHLDRAAAGALEEAAR